MQLTPAVQYVVTARQIEALPSINRHVATLVAVSPGVTSALADEPALGLFSSDGVVSGGGQGGSSDWFLDGAPLGARLQVRDVHPDTSVIAPQSLTSRSGASG